MKKRMRSVISLLLAILMLVSSTPLVRVQAENADADLSNGLLAHYDFENVTGTTVPNTADAAAYPAAISGSATVVDLEGITTPSKALQLGSAAGGMQLTDIVNASTSSFSVSLWYKATATSSSNVNLVQAGTMDGSTGRTILILAPDSTYYTYLTGDSSNVKTAAVSPTTWQHITLSYDQAANKVYFFVNGAADNADGVTLSGTALDTDDMIIGRHRNAGEGQFNGFIDEVRVYNKVLSAAEAAAIYDSTKDAYNLPPAAPVGDITLTVDAADVQQVIDSDSIFGINHRYAFNGYGSFDSVNMEIKEDFLALYQDAGFGSIRYPGGTISNLFNWKTTVGPVEQRKNQIHGFYNNAGQGGIAPNFGLAEIGTFAEIVDSEIVYVYSLGRGNAQDAADLIEYLNAKVGTNPNGGIDWAAVRAENGHEEPYNVRYFEIGNEMQQAYGSAYDGTASQGYWTTYVAEGSEAAYIDGGTATFTQQYAVCEEDWNATASLSDGSANMVRYMRYANVNPKMDDGNGNVVDDPTFQAVNDGVSVYVGSTQWTVVDSFKNSGASDTHAVIDYSTGAIHFGDGVNGAIPAAGQQIYVSYSVDREGFIAVSQAMRDITDAINKAEGTQHEINIYSSYESSGFITKMADRSANDLYDGLTIHPYSGTPDGTGETFYDSAMYKAEATGIANVQNYVNMMPADKVPVISEYGIFRSTDSLVRSQTHAIYIAKVLMEYVRLGSPYIQKHCLIDWYSSGADSLGPTQQAVIQAVAGTDANTTTGEGTFTFFSTPSAHVFRMLNSAFADNVIATAFSSTPTMSNGAQILSALASKDSDGTVYLAIVNASREVDCELTLDLQNFELEGASITAQVLTADSFDAQNSPDAPDNVTVTTETVTVDPENFTYTVPKHTFVILTIDPVNAVPTKQVAVHAGETVTITDDTGNYQDAVVRTELDESIAAVTVTGTTTAAEKTLVGEITSLTSGGKYILVSDRAQKPMTNATASVVAADGTMTGLSLSGTVDAMADNAIWTITQVDGGYTVQDAEGKYLSIAMNNVTLSDTESIVDIVYSGSYWNLGSGGAYLNDAGAAATCASGYSSATGFGSQWSIYEVSATPASASTRIDITGVSAGTTYVQVGPTGYEITVTQPEPFSAAFADPYAQVGQPMNVEVKGASDAVTYTWTVGGTYVSSDASYTPTEDDLMKWIGVTVTSGSDTAKLEMFFSKLPVVYINTENNAEIVSKEEYINAELTIQGNETYNAETSTLYDGVTEIRGRGNSTWVQPKKPYRLKLDKKTDVFGMGKSKHWVLLANYMDESLLRNTLSYDLSGAMGMEHCSTVFVDVILNGEFIGNYQFCENIRVDGNRVDIFDWEGFAEDSAAVIADAEGLSSDLEDYMLENMDWITSGTVTWDGTTYSIADYPDIEIPSINGGYLLELDEYYDEVSKFRTNSNQPIMFKNPEFVCTNSDMMEFVQTYVQAFEDAVGSDSYTAAYEGETVHYSDLYDFDALVDYWLINEIFFNEELNKKSTYMYKDIDGLMFMGPIWDMDWSSGGEGETYHTEQWATRYYSTNAQANNWYKYLIQDPYFFIRAQERYWEIRDAQVADMMTQIDTSYDLLKESAAANGERWSYGSDYKTYVDDLRNWFNSHLTWLDTQMATQDSLRDSLGYYASSRLALTLTDAGGNALAADSAEHAPADGVAEMGQSLKLTITGGNNTDGNAVLYVNGRRTSVTAITANSTITVDVPGDSLTAAAGEKNVLEVQIEAADGSINASRYVTVAMTAHEHVFDQQKAEADFLASDATCTAAATYYYSCTCGEKGTETFSYGDVGTHNYENGTCTVCGEAEPIPGAAVNVTTQAVYDTLEEALMAAVSGETVKLLTDVTEDCVLVHPGVTLDLNGHVATANYAVGFKGSHMVDNAGGGKLVTGEQDVVLDESNAMLPVYDGTGYIFTEVGFAIRQAEGYTGNGIKIEAIACPKNMDAVELLKGGAADNNLQVMIVLTWDNEQGTGSQKFFFTDKVVASVYNSNNGTWADYKKMFTMVITGIERVENLKANIVLVSGTNAQRGTTPVSIN